MAYSKKPHRLHTPTGKEITYDTERQARMFFGMLLHDNGYCAKAEAQRHGKAIVVGETYWVEGVGAYLMESDA